MLPYVRTYVVFSESRRFPRAVVTPAGRGRFPVVPADEPIARRAVVFLYFWRVAYVGESGQVVSWQRRRPKREGRVAPRSRVHYRHGAAEVPPTDANKRPRLSIPFLLWRRAYFGPVCWCPWGGGSQAAALRDKGGEAAEN